MSTLQMVKSFFDEHGRHVTVYVDTDDVQVLISENSVRFAPKEKLHEPHLISFKKEIWEEIVKFVSEESSKFHDEKL